MTKITPLPQPTQRYVDETARPDSVFYAWCASMDRALREMQTQIADLETRVTALEAP